MSDAEIQVKRVFYNLFGSDPEAIGLFALLQTYQGSEQARVQLAILKLSEGDPDKLKYNIEAAKIDFRDVLAWAEYPEQMQTGASVFNSDPDVIGGILERDKDQYREWLSEQSDS